MKYASFGRRETPFRTKLLLFKSKAKRTEMLMKQKYCRWMGNNMPWKDKWMRKKKPRRNKWKRNKKTWRDKWMRNKKPWGYKWMRNKKTWRERCMRMKQLRGDKWIRNNQPWRDKWMRMKQPWRDKWIRKRKPWEDKWKSHLKAFVLRLAFSRDFRQTLKNCPLISQNFVLFEDIFPESLQFFPWWKFAQ